MGETEPASAVVCDAGPIIHLDELESLDLLADFHPVLVPPAVWREVETHRASALARPEIVFLRDTPAEHPDPSLRALLQAFSLDAGEREALLLMQRHPRALLITDDAAARLVGERLGFRVHGTIGILIRAIRRGQRTAREILVLLAQIPARSSLHVRPALLQEIAAQLSRVHPEA
jgi:predicted nucleic acid-binding protein